MNWTWFLFSFEGRINRAKLWFAAFIWFATVFSFMTIFLLVIAGILRGSGNGFHSVSARTMHPAFYLLGFPLLVIGVLFAATSIKRLHDRGKKGWWLAPFFFAPGLLDKLSDWLDNLPHTSSCSWGCSPGSWLGSSPRFSSRRNGRL